VHQDLSLLITVSTDGDFLFQTARRTFTQDASAAGINIFAYLFTDPDAVVPAQVISAVLPAPPAPGSLGGAFCVLSLLYFL
jgi:hypothetical protein